MKILQNGFFLIIVSAIIVAIWFYNHLQIALHSDFIYLSVSAQKMIAGEMMSQAYYDTNPPLSMIVYIIPAWISEYFNIPLYYPLGLYSLSLVLISCFLLNTIITKIIFFSSNTTNSTRGCNNWTILIIYKYIIIN